MVLFFDPDFPANDPVEHIIEHELYQHVKIFPEVLCHETEESQEGPAEAIKAGVAVVWIPPSFHTRVALGAAAEVVLRRDKTGETERRERREEKKQGTGPGMTQQLFTCHVKLTPRKREEPTAGSWSDQRRFAGGAEQLTQSLSCSHTGARPAGRAGSRNWLRRDIHSESSRARILSQTRSCTSFFTPRRAPLHHPTCLQVAHVFSFCGANFDNYFCLFCP